MMQQEELAHNGQGEKSTPKELFQSRHSTETGLSDAEAQARLQRYGRNVLEEKRASLLKTLLGYFWGPIPWMIEAAAILSAIAGDWNDFTIVVALLVFNALIGFWEEHKAANALDALKRALALKARVLRGNQWQVIDAAELVPGDVVRLRLGDVIPADVKLLSGDFLSVDQSALTGESLPVNKQPGETAYAGSVAKQGEMLALVTATGSGTYFGRTAKLVQGAGAASHFQQAVMKVGDFLILVAAGLSLILVIVQLHRGAPFMDLIQFVLILVVASIPVAMPAVLSVTMALGALALSKMKAIVSRLQAIEEMAGVDILCSDKTGTLTENKLTLGQPSAFAQASPQAVLLAGALASKEENADAIDVAVLGGLEAPTVLSNYEQLEFVPFNPVDKRTQATVRDPKGHTFQVTKGAPQVIVSLCALAPQESERVEGLVNELATKGYRTLGVARSDQKEAWRFLGILPLFDPPRKDAAEVIAQAKAHGIKVKMVTGDNVAIGHEVASQLGMGTAIQAAGKLFEDGGTQAAGDETIARIEQADGFAEVFPEHKYAIVKALQRRGHLVAMTGDGVNDAPALKQAEVGVAVSGATDAARAAAALVLTAPGLSVIIQAVEEARRIFERMMSYTMYRISMTIDIMVFVVLAMLLLNVYPLTAVMIVVLALLDDIPIMTIAYDRTYLSPTPVRWDMHRVLSIAIALGFLSVIQTFGLMYVADRVLQLDVPHLQTMIFLQLVIGGHLMLFLTRNRHPFWEAPYPSWQLFGAIVATQIFAALMSGFGWLVPGLSWRLIGLVWIYNLVWMLIQDVVKCGVYRLLEQRARHHRVFLDRVNQPLRGQGY
jgi:H+-transporting ATPase